MKKTELKLSSFVHVTLQVFIATWLLCQTKVKPVINVSQLQSIALMPHVTDCNDHWLECILLCIKHSLYMYSKWHEIK